MQCLPLSMILFLGLGPPASLRVPNTMHSFIPGHLLSTDYEPGTCWGVRNTEVFTAERGCIICGLAVQATRCVAESHLCGFAFHGPPCMPPALVLSWSPTSPRPGALVSAHLPSLSPLVLSGPQSFLKLFLRSCLF